MLSFHSLVLGAVLIAGNLCLPGASLRAQQADAAAGAPAAPTADDPAVIVATLKGYAEQTASDKQVAPFALQLYLLATAWAVLDQHSPYVDACFAATARNVATDPDFQTAPAKTHFFLRKTGSLRDLDALHVAKNLRTTYERFLRSEMERAIKDGVRVLQAYVTAMTRLAMEDEAFLQLAVPRAVFALRQQKYIGSVVFSDLYFVGKARKARIEGAGAVLRAYAASGQVPANMVDSLARQAGRGDWPVLPTEYPPETAKTVLGQLEQYEQQFAAEEGIHPFALELRCLAENWYRSGQKSSFLELCFATSAQDVTVDPIFRKAPEPSEIQELRYLLPLYSLGSAHMKRHLQPVYEKMLKAGIEQGLRDRLPFAEAYRKAMRVLTAEHEAMLNTAVAPAVEVIKSHGYVDYPKLTTGAIQYTARWMRYNGAYAVLSGYADQKLFPRGLVDTYAAEAYQTGRAP